jgi:hypothetical protein
MKRSIFLKAAAPVIVMLISLSCLFGSQVAEDLTADEPSAVDQPQSSNPEPTEAGVVKSCAEAPPQDYSGPAPQAGTGNLYGHLLWNSSPLSGQIIQTCTDANYKNECESATFSATSDSDGAFVIANIPPGEYDVVVHAIDQEKWLDVRDLTNDYSTVEIASDQCLAVGNIHLIKYDLFQKEPGNNTKLSESRPALTWDAYPDAAYYEVYLVPEGALKPIYVQERVDTNQITPQEDLPVCYYNWNVTAFNSQSVAIATTEEFYYFYILDQPLSCYIVNNVPASKSTVSGENLVLSWDAHPLADHYKIAMVMSEPSYAQILDNVEVTEPRYALEVTLAPGEYYWNVYGIDQFGETVASDEGNTYLTVK